ncbi:pH nine-sensitive protein 1 [Cryptotrichosporon argae]
MATKAETDAPGGPPAPTEGKPAMHNRKWYFFFLGGLAVWGAIAVFGCWKFYVYMWDGASAITSGSGGSATTTASASSVSARSTSTSTTTISLDFSSDMRYSMMVAAGIAGACSILVMTVLKLIPQVLVYAIPVLTVGAYVVASGLMLYSGNIEMGAIFAATALLLALLAWHVWSRFRLAQAMIRTASQLATWHVYGFGAIGVFLHVVIGIACGCAICGLLALVSDTSNLAYIALIVAEVFLYGWISASLSGFFLGVVAAGPYKGESRRRPWWHRKTKDEPPAPTHMWRIARALHASSAGSYALGGLFFEIVDVLYHIVKAMSNPEHQLCSVTACICSPILYWLEKFVQWFNKYIFITIAVVDPTPNYKEAVDDVKELLTASAQGHGMCGKRRMAGGLTALANDSLVSTVFHLGSFLFAGLATAATYYYEHVDGDKTLTSIVVCVFAFVVSFAISSLLTSILAGGVSTILVLLFQNERDPHQPNLQHLLDLGATELHDVMKEVWEKDQKRTGWLAEQARRGNV